MQQQTQQPMQQANYTDDHVCDEHLFTMSQPCMAASTEIWYVDSGCTSHMARDAGMFTTLDMNATTTVKLGNGDMVKAAGKGKVLIQTKSGPKIIDNVLYIPDLAQNLLSVAQLLKRGYSLTFEGNLCIILDSKKYEIVRVRMHENSFHIDFNHVKLNASMSKNDMVRDMQAKSRTDDLCDACLMSKHDMVKDVQATSHTYGLRDACQNGKAPMKSKIDGVFDGHSSNESVMDDGAVAKSDSLFLKTRNQALSSTKAEYIAAAAAPKQAKWIKKVSTNLNCVEKKPIGLWCNNSAFSVVKNPVQHGRSKHNNVKFHAIREVEKNGETDFSISSIIWFLYQIIFNFLELAFSCRVYPPSKAEIEVLERQCGSIPMKFCHVEHGRVSFFFFNKVELPILP
ncbi:hypothetical protein EZV62_005319 [Acer yangbiense]|uniref:Retrovirus-related Pol polyprotein from transposon TNT 1-94-like beta-barrel domain-containing protein n=1 Tax=Acer yangbiense TaxID=1000413 RepID=A0A5C7INF8_9ROSI|nr:hypothetical protein EZV62_005319 [Acer yangbiense]